MNIEKLFNKYSYLSKKDFITLAYENNLKQKDAKNYYQNNIATKTTNIIKDKNPYRIIPFLDSYMIDIVFFDGKHGYLYIIHVPSRKIFIQKIKSKSSNDVLSAFKKFYYQGLQHKDINRIHISSILSDAEASFVRINTNFSRFMDDENILYKIKDENEHNIFSILDSSVAVIKKLLYKNLIKLSVNNMTVNRFDKII